MLKETFHLKTFSAWYAPICFSELARKADGLMIRSHNLCPYISRGADTFIEQHMEDGFD